MNSLRSGMPKNRLLLTFVENEEGEFNVKVGSRFANYREIIPSDEISQYILKALSSVDHQYAAVKIRINYKKGFD